MAKFYGGVILGVAFAGSAAAAIHIKPFIVPAALCGILIFMKIMFDLIENWE